MSINVNLAVSNTAQSGYASTTGSDNNTYYYKYTGGSDGSGSITETLGSPQDILVSLDTSGYKITGVSFSNDPEEQLSYSNLTDSQVTINDADTIAEANAYYSITVGNSAGTVTFPCDPRITNEN